MSSRHADVVRRRKLPPPAGSSVYELTDHGRELEPIVLSLGTWAARLPSFPRGVPVGTDSVVLALGTFFDADAADGLNAGYELRLGEDTFTVRVADRRIELGRGSADHSGRDHRNRRRHAGLAAVGRARARRRLRAGDATIDGDRRVVDRFLALFPHPRDLATVS